MVFLSQYQNSPSLKAVTFKYSYSCCSPPQQRSVYTPYLKHQGLGSLKAASLASVIHHELEEGILSNECKGKSEREGKRKIVLCLDLVIKICFIDPR